MDDVAIDLCLLNGSIREKIAKLLRTKSKVIAAFGACACVGGIPALANFTNRADIFERAYVEALSKTILAVLFTRPLPRLARVNWSCLNSLTPNKPL